MNTIRVNEKERDYASINTKEIIPTPKLIKYLNQSNKSDEYVTAPIASYVGENRYRISIVLNENKKNNILP